MTDDKRTARNQRYYEKRKELLKAKRRENYSKNKQQETNFQSVYNEKSINVLLNLKDYTNLSKQQKSLWLNFSWALKKLNEGIADITEIQELEKRCQVLISDYWTNAQQKAIKSKKNWDVLSEEERIKFVSFLSKKRVEFDEQLTEKELLAEEKSELFKKEISLWLNSVSYHEDLGRKTCLKSKEICDRCKFANEAEKSFWNDLKNEEKKQINSKESCSNCSKIRKLNDNGICSNCQKQFNNN